MELESTGRRGAWHEYSKQELITVPFPLSSAYLTFQGRHSYNAVSNVKALAGRGQTDHSSYI